MHVVLSATKVISVSVLPSLNGASCGPGNRASSVDASTREEDASSLKKNLRVTQSLNTVRKSGLDSAQRCC